MMKQFKVNSLFPFDRLFFGKPLRRIRFNNINVKSEKKNLDSVDDFNKYMHQLAISNSLAIVKK